jgi:DNA mismatch endonuclease (patch repair protein)
MTSGPHLIGYERNSARTVRVDTFDKATRSKVMAKVRGRGNASTEIKLMKLFRANGIKGWRRHFPITGRPDFAFPKTKVAVFVDGCFWHGCPSCYTAPSSSRSFWETKLSKNKARDVVVTGQLRCGGWKVLRVWECQLKKPAAFLRRIRAQLMAEQDRRK